MNSRQTSTSWDLSCTGCISFPTAIRLVGPENDRLVSNVQTPNISSILFWSLDKAEKKNEKKIFGFFSFLASFCLYYYILVQKQSIFTMTSYWFHKSIEDLIGCTVPLWLMAEICTRRSVGGDRDCATPRRVRMNITNIECCISLCIYLDIYVYIYICI